MNVYNLALITIFKYNIIMEKRFIGMVCLLFFALPVWADNYNAYYRPSVSGSVQMAFAPYMSSVKSTIQKNWHPPDVIQEGHVTVLFKLDKNGRLISSRILESSGNEIFDESALDALKKSEPFGIFPADSPREQITINYTFDSSLVSTDKMKEFIAQSDKYFYSDKNTALKYINLAINEVSGDERAYFLYDKRSKLRTALGDIKGAEEDLALYKDLKAKVDIKRVHAIKHQAEIENTPYAYFYLAYSYEQIKDYENAIHAINKAIDMTELNNQYKRYRTELVKKYEI